MQIFFLLYGHRVYGHYLGSQEDVNMAIWPTDFSRLYLEQIGSLLNLNWPQWFGEQVLGGGKDVNNGPIRLTKQTLKTSVSRFMPFPLVVVKLAEPSFHSNQHQ